MVALKPGKVPPEVMEKTIFPFLGAKRPEVLVHSKIGEDCSVIDFGEYVCVLSTDPITGADKEIGRLAVHISCNDLAANGAEPIGIMATILFPDGTEEDKVKEVMEQIHNAALEINAEVLGGHTEITSSVSRIVVSATAIGRALKSEYVTSSGAQPGDDVILTKKAGLEGTAVIASDFQEFLKGKMSSEEIERAKGFINYISVIPEGRLGAKNGATAMHDVTEGGVLGAAYEIALASKVGITLWEDRIPVHPETLKICQIFNLNPLGLISSGSMLITAPDGNRIISALKEAGIEATIIGKVTEEGFRIVDKEGKERPFTPPERDELYKIL